ncbi:MAG: hypothetical protein HYR55_09215 [Acidobacteria bacterium]|nr:hypothetical protein [Acidobacteriota bacterium]MBI3656662.1 hypothetical protein [Acidobacteriota bacterium]
MQFKQQAPAFNDRSEGGWAIIQQLSFSAATATSNGGFILKHVEHKVAALKHGMMRRMRLIVIKLTLVLFMVEAP